MSRFLINFFLNKNVIVADRFRLEIRFRNTKVLEKINVIDKTIRDLSMIRESRLNSFSRLFISCNRYKYKST